MFGNNICIFEKFSICKNGDNCRFEHPTLVCDDQDCDIRMCFKRHPQDCLYYTNFNNCKNGDDSCKFHHRKNASNNIDLDKYRELEEKYNAILLDHQKLLLRIEVLENKDKNSETSKACCTRAHGDVKRKLDSQEKNSDMAVNVAEGDVHSSSKKNKVQDVRLVSDDDNKMEVSAIVNDNAKSDEVTYGEYFKIYEDELKNVKRIVDGERENIMKVTKKEMLKERIKTIGIKKNYSFSYVTKNMKERSKIFETNFKRSFDKIEKAENTKFKKVTSAELQKMINLCKKEQNIMK